MESGRGVTATDRLWTWAAAGVVGVVTAGLAFRDGGYFADGAAAAAVAALLLLLVRVMSARRPLAGLTPWGVVAALVLLGFVCWVALSGGWSPGEARGVPELVRALAYLAVLVVFATLPDGARAARLVLRATFLALGAAVVAGVVARLAPDLLDVAASRLNARLSWPLGYWNAFGLSAGIVALLGVHLASDAREHAVVRLLGSAVVPVACVGLYLSLSRGAIAATTLGLVVLLALRGVPAIVALLAVAAPAAVAVLAAYDAATLVDVELLSEAARAEGAAVGGTLLRTAAASAALTALVLLLGRWVRRPGWARPWRLRAVSAAAALVVVLLAVGAGAPDRLADEWRTLTSSGTTALSPQSRERLQTVGTNGRTDQWRVAVDAFGRRPLRGSGAGTYELTWQRERPIDITARDAHSLYLETAAELGAVGLGLLAVGLLLPTLLLMRRLGTDPIWAAAAAVVVAWLAHAGIDWDWEVPALTLWAFAVLGAATAGRGRDAPVAYLPRMLVGLLLLGALVAPVRLGLSQLALTRSAEAFRAGDCAATTTSALAANRWLDVRPEPLALLAYCDAREGRDALGRRLARAALARDPQDWSLRYSVGLVDAATGRDPRPALRAAIRANPREPRPRLVLEVLEREPRRTWPALARRAPLPLLSGRRTTQR